MATNEPLKPCPICKDPMVQFIADPRFLDHKLEGSRNCPLNHMRHRVSDWVARTATPAAIPTGEGLALTTVEEEHLVAIEKWAARVAEKGLGDPNDAVIVFAKVIRRWQALLQASSTGAQAEAGDESECDGCEGTGSVREADDIGSFAQECEKCKGSGGVALPKPEARPEGDGLLKAAKNILLSMDAEWENGKSGGHDWPEAVADLRAALRSPGAGAWRPIAVWGLQVWNRDNIDSAPEGLYQFFMDGHESELPTVQLFTKKGISELVIWYSNTGHPKAFAYGPLPQPPAPTTGEAG